MKFWASSPAADAPAKVGMRSSLDHWVCVAEDIRRIQATSRKRKMRCTTRISMPMMICSEDAAAMVGSPATESEKRFALVGWSIAVLI